jgi:succinate dehydrogenase / fumarate reductase cytochrome b subunit
MAANEPSHDSPGSAARAVAPRPKYLDLFKIRLPAPGLLSILHRISGFGLFLLTPLLLWLLQLSLGSTEDYVRFRAMFAEPLVKLILIGLLWAYLHHLFAGIRFLAMDMHFGTSLRPARATSYVVMIGAAILTIALGVWLW